MATARILMGFICFAFIGSYWKSDRNLLDQRAERKKILNTARQEIGTRELSGKNDGVRVEMYLKYVGMDSGQPWCAAFISWIFNQNGFSQPRTAWSPSMFPASRILHPSAKNALPANVYGIYFTTKKRIAHVGLVEHIRNDWVTGIEGNTNIEGSNDGDGVYRKLRPIRGIQCFADWVKK